MNGLLRIRVYSAWEFLGHLRCYLSAPDNSYKSLIPTPEPYEISHRIFIVHRIDVCLGLFNGASGWARAAESSKFPCARN